MQCSYGLSATLQVNLVEAPSATLENQMLIALTLDVSDLALQEILQSCAPTDISQCICLQALVYSPGINDAGEFYASSQPQTQEEEQQLQQLLPVEVSNPPQCQQGAFDPFVSTVTQQPQQPSQDSNSKGSSNKVSKANRGSAR